MRSGVMSADTCGFTKIQRTGIVKNSSLKTAMQ